MATLHLETASFDAWTDALVVEFRRPSAHPLRAEAAERIVESVQRACRSVGTLHLDRGAALPSAGASGDDLRSLATAQREAADVVAQGLEALADGHVTRSEGARLERECDEALAALLAIRELARRAQVEGVIPMTRRGAA